MVKVTISAWYLYVVWNRLPTRPVLPPRNAPEKPGARLGTGTAVHELRAERDTIWVVGVSERTGELRDTLLDLLERCCGTLGELGALADPRTGEDELEPDLGLLVEPDRRPQLLGGAGGRRGVDLPKVRLVPILREHVGHEVATQVGGEPVERGLERRSRGGLAVALEAREKAELEELVDTTGRHAQRLLFVGIVAVDHDGRGKSLDELVGVLVEDLPDTIDGQARPVREGERQHVGLDERLEQPIGRPLRHVLAHDVLESRRDLPEPVDRQLGRAGTVPSPLEELVERDEERARREGRARHIGREELREDGGLVATAPLLVLPLLTLVLLVVCHDRNHTFPPRPQARILYCLSSVSIVEVLPDVATMAHIE